MSKAHHLCETYTSKAVGGIFPRSSLFDNTEDAKDFGSLEYDKTVFCEAAAMFFSRYEDELVVR